MSSSETPRGNVSGVPRRNILDALTGSRSENPVQSVADQKTAKKKKEEKCIMEKNLEVLYDRRDMLVDKLLRMNETLRAEDVNIHLLQLHLETLRRCADDYERINADICSMLPRDERAEQRREYATFEELHNQLYICLNTKIEAASPATSRNQVAVPQSPVYVHQQVPQLHAPFPTFDGNPENWYSFKSLFTSIMAKYANETPAMKILHLRNCLTGEAKDKIDQDVVNNNDYDMAWKILKDAYEDKRLIMDTHIDAILDFPKISKENRGKSISKLVEVCAKHADALRGHGYAVEGLSELIIVNVLYKKLDRETQEQWELKLGTGTMPVFKEFMDFLREMGRVLQRTNRSQQQTSQQSTVLNKQRQALNQKQSVPASSRSFVQTTKENCPCCREEHNIYKCTKFQELSVGERKSIVTRANLCFNCLKSKHRVADCPSEQGCKIRGCGRKHHSLLHPSDAQKESSEAAKPPPKSVEQSESSGDGSQKEGATTLCAQGGTVKRQVLLSTAEVLVVGKGGTTIKSRALLDSGSDSNIVTEKLASKLNLKLQQVDLPVSGLNDIQTRVKYIVSTNIVSRINSFSSSILDFLVVPKVTSNLPVTEVDYRSWPLPAHVKLADPSFHTPGEIDLIIGNEIFFDLIKQGRLKLGKNEATLTETELGWVVGGSVQTRKSKECLRVCQLNHQDEMLNKTLMRFWEIENVGTESNLTVAEALVEEHFEKTHVREEDGRYTVRLPFNDRKEQLGESFEMASKRLDKLLISLAKDPAKREQYFAFMAEYLSLGHMEEINEDDRDGYYIPE